MMTRDEKGAFRGTTLIHTMNVCTLSIPYIVMYSILVYKKTPASKRDRSQSAIPLYIGYFNTGYNKTDIYPL